MSGAAILAVEKAASLLGIAALVSAVGGFATNIFAIKKSRKEEHVETREQLSKAGEQLSKCREESERYARELHELKMSKYES